MNIIYERYDLIYYIEGIIYVKKNTKYNVKQTMKCYRT